MLTPTLLAVLAVITGSASTQAPLRDDEPDAAEDVLAPLVEAAARGDAAAGRQLLDAVGPIFLRAGRRTLGRSHPDLEDFVQDAALRFFRSLTAFRGESRVRHYAYKIATYVSADWIRTRQALKRSRVQGELPSHVAGLQDPTRDVQWQRVGALLDRTLSPEQLEAFLLRTLMGCSLAEVASATGVPENTVRSRLRLAKENLRRALSRHPHLLEGGEVSHE